METLANLSGDQASVLKELETLVGKEIPAKDAVSQHDFGYQVEGAVIVAINVGNAH